MMASSAARTLRSAESIALVVGSPAALGVAYPFLPGRMRFAGDPMSTHFTQHPNQSMKSFGAGRVPRERGRARGHVGAAEGALVK